MPRQGGPMDSLMLPEYQSNFPYEDVSETNRELFKQLLLDPDYIESAHDLAEQHVIAFKLGHQTLRSLSITLGMDYNQVHSFSYGATIYESISTTVKPIGISLPPVRAIYTKMEDVLTMSADPFGAAMTLRDQHEQLTEEAPNMLALIDFATELQPQIDNQYVRMGAALEWIIDRDIVH